MNSYFPAFKDRRWNWLVKLRLLGLVVVMSGCRQRNTSDVETGKSNSNSSGSVYAQGRIVPTGGIASVVGLASEQVESFEPGIREILKVEKDQPLGYFSSHQLRRRELLVPRLGQLGQQGGTRTTTEDDISELGAKKGQVELLELVYRAAEEQHQRIVRLDERSDIISQQQIAQSRLRVNQALAEWKAADIQYKTMIN